MADPWSKGYVPNKAAFAREWERLRLKAHERVEQVSRYLRLHPDATWKEVASRHARAWAPV